MTVPRLWAMTQRGASGPALRERMQRYVDPVMDLVIDLAAFLARLLAGQLIGEGISEEVRHSPAKCGGMEAAGTRPLPHPASCPQRHHRQQRASVPFCDQPLQNPPAPPGPG